LLYFLAEFVDKNSGDIMNIGIIGTGYVGLVTGACFAEFGVQVTCMDSNAKKIDGLKKGIVPIYEPGLEELVRKNLRDHRLVFTTDIRQAVETALTIFIAVGTPPRGDGVADLSSVETVARGIADHLNGYKVIALKSTVPVGTGERLRAVISERLKERVDFDIVSNPEFLREGSAIEDFMRPNRVIIGTISPQAVAIMKDLYRPLYLLDTPFIITDNTTAEMIKYAANAFLATKISFINEIANLCEKVGGDIHTVAKGIGLDGRIGPKFLHPGPGFGGSCLPKDIRALNQLSTDNQYDFKLLQAVLEVNARQRVLMLDKIKTALGTLKNRTVGILGLAYKPNTDDIRESPAIDLIRLLQTEGASLRVYDPAGMEGAKLILKGVNFCSGPYEVAKGADAIILATEWNEFRNLNLESLKQALKQPVFVDLRNVYDPAKMTSLGFRYIGVGRSTNLSA
jgi:UDPglucose 6-dehydrogenase